MVQRLPVLGFMLVVALVLAAVVSAAPPAGFSDTLVTPVASPTALAFTPDGRLLITSQTGQLHVFQSGTLTTALDLRAPNLACVNHERGLLGVAVDPAFATNHFIYLYYTFNKFPSSNQQDNCPDAQPTNPNNPVNRVARFVLPASNVVDLGSETVLIDNIPSTNGNHNAGDLHFGKDGYLYISVGDGGCDYARTHGCAGGNKAARDQFILLGKILRITSDGGVPPSNPWLGADNARCYDPAPGGNHTGRNADGKKCRETFAWGLRNPFRFAFDPNAAGTRLFINDVGQGTWEEIDEGQAGADYGWSVREGHCAEGSTTNCGPQPAGMTNPIFDYPHGSAPNNCNAITGGAFVPNSLWPVEFDGAYLYSDYVCGRIFTLTRAGNSYTSAPFSPNAGVVIAMTFGPLPNPQALYYTTFSNSGQVRKIAYTGSANRSPTASASASPTSGAAPLAVSFDGSGSSDPDGDPLTDEWDFGDGSAHASMVSPSHTYTATGTYTATLTVRDGRGGSDSALVRIDVGNTPPVPSINAPAANFRYRVGQQIVLQGSATDAEDGTLPGASLSWRALLHHNEHTHPLLPPTSGVSVTITAPAPEDLAATNTSYLEVFLSATDSRGLTSVITRELRPHLVDVTLATDPTGLVLAANDTTITGPRALVSWEGYVLSVAAADQQDARGQTWLFDHWSDGGAAAHTITTPAEAATYTATFKPAPGTKYMRFIPLVKR
jgi:glucose/arabinose dehydrogenase/PKD repeat protein